MGGWSKVREACCRLTEDDGEQEKTPGGGTVVSLTEGE